MHLGSKHSEETKIRIRSYHHTDDAKKRISKSLKLRSFKIGDWSKGKTPWNKGLSPSKETREKLRLALKGKKKPSVSESNSKRVCSEKTKQKFFKHGKDIMASNWAN